MEEIGIDNRAHGVTINSVGTIDSRSPHDSDGTVELEASEHTCYTLGTFADLGYEFVRIFSANYLAQWPLRIRLFRPPFCEQRITQSWLRN